MHWKSLLPGPQTKKNHLAAGQRWSYLSGAVQWYGDLLGLLFFIFLLAGAANLATGGGQLFRKLTVAAVPVLVLLGLVRALALLRRSTGAAWRDAIGAFFIWQSTSLVVARASVLALFANKAAFLRTPKTSERTSGWHALRANWAETVLALFGAAGIAGALTTTSTLSGPLLAGLLFVPTLGGTSDNPDRHNDSDRNPERHDDPDSLSHTDDPGRARHALRDRHAHGHLREHAAIPAT